MSALIQHTQASNYLEKYFTPEQLAIRSEQRTNAKVRLVGPRSIFIILNVLGDGFGDLMNGLHAYRIIKDAYPNWVMRILILSGHDRIPMTLNQWGFNEEECLVIKTKHKITEPRDDELTLFYGKIGTILNMNYPPNQEKDAALRLKLPTLAKRIDDFIDFSKIADLHISVSTSTTLLPESVNKLDPKFMYFVEYGGNPDPIGKSFCMGLKPHSCGIYILNPHVPEEFSNPILKKYYEEKKGIYFSYGGNNSGDIQEYISFLNYSNPEAKELNIVSNISYEKIQEMASTLHKEGIPNIAFIDKNDHEIKNFNSEPFGKLVRFINPFPLCQGDMMRAMKHSAEPVGVTGNSTFSEILALDQLPFYHLRYCVAAFWKELIYLADRATPDAKELIGYLRHCSFQIQKDHPEGHNEELGKVEISVLKKQWLAIAAILRKDWNVKKAYLGEINRQILSQESSKQF